MEMEQSNDCECFNKIIGTYLKKRFFWEIKMRLKNGLTSNKMKYFKETYQLFSKFSSSGLT